MKKPTKQSSGGKARAEKLSPERRSEIAKQAASKRWNAPAKNDGACDQCGWLHVKIAKSKGAKK
jgi:hypothetical protein